MFRVKMACELQRDEELSKKTTEISFETDELQITVKRGYNEQFGNDHFCSS